MDRDHVRVLDRGGEARFAGEAGAKAWVGREVRRDELQRSHPVEGDVAGSGDDAHAAASELAPYPMNPQLGADPRLCADALLSRRPPLGLSPQAPGFVLGAHAGSSIMLRSSAGAEWV